MQAEEAAKNTGKTAEEITEKYGLEAGLWNVFRNKDEPTGKGRGTQAKDLLKRYGSAYLITSITLSLFSFGICYVLVSSGAFQYSSDMRACPVCTRNFKNTTEQVFSASEAVSHYDLCS